MSKSFYFDALCNSIVEEVAELAASVSTALMQWCDSCLQPLGTIFTSFVASWPLNMFY